MVGRVRGFEPPLRPERGLYQAELHSDGLSLVPAFASQSLLWCYRYRTIYISGMVIRSRQSFERLAAKIYGEQYMAIHGDTGSSAAHWTSWSPFLLASVGFAGGWATFGVSYNTGENGGAAFVLVYLVCVFTIGVPILMAELFIGRRWPSPAKLCNLSLLPAVAVDGVG